MIIINSKQVLFFVRIVYNNIICIVFMFIQCLYIILYYIYLYIITLICYTMYILKHSTNIMYQGNNIDDNIVNVIKLI